MSGFDPLPPKLVSDSERAAQWAKRICLSWRQSVESIIATGELIAEAKEDLPHGEFGRMIETELPFSTGTAQRLMAIAADPRLVKPAHGPLLPASWRTLYELTKLSDEQFDRGVNDKIIRPDMERAEIASKIKGVISAGTSNQALTADEIVDDGNDAPLPNGARAIMASRQEPDDSLDYFPTPPWATRALIECVLPIVGARADFSRHVVWEPACGEGHMAEVLREYCADVTASDIHDHGYNDYQVDFLTCDHFNQRDQDAEWIITNPPFGEKTEDFVLRALDLARIGIAMFVRLQWLETIGRYEAVFRDHPPTCIAFFAERVNLCKGRWEPDGTTATAYIWLVWIKGRAPRAPFWIPPGQREALTRSDDRERFTARPVIKIAQLLPPSYPATGQVLDAPPSAPSPAATPSSHLDIPSFLRRGDPARPRSP